MGRCVHEADEKWGGESKGADEKWGGESVTPTCNPSPPSKAVLPPVSWRHGGGDSYQVIQGRV